MRSAKRGIPWLMAIAIGMVVLAAPLRASATFVVALQEDGGPIATVASGPSFSRLTIASVTFGDYTLSSLSATSSQFTLRAGLISSVGMISSLVAATHTLSVYLSSQDFTGPLVPSHLATGISGTILPPRILDEATFQGWVDAGNGLMSIPGTFTIGLQTADFAQPGQYRTFATVRFEHPPLYSLTDRATFTTTGVGQFTYNGFIVFAPEPDATPIMLMIGLVGLFLAVRLRKA